MEKRLVMTKDIEHLFNVFEEKGKELYLVGGCVRDMLLGLEPKDYDFATNALPQEVMTYFEHTIPTGIDYGTVTVVLNGESYEITTYRKDHDADGRRPKAVSFSETIEEDLSRRDFTINAMAMDSDGYVIDLYSGKQDLRDKVIRFVGKAEARVAEDKLRLIRGIRFATTYDFEIERKDYEAVYLTAKVLNFSMVSAERFQSELNKILLSDRPEKGVRLLIETGIMDAFIPEMRAIVGLEQNTPYHYTDVFNHTLDMLSKTPKDKATRIASLLHDIGKACTYTVDEKGVGHFYGHDELSADMATDILRRLKYDKKTIVKVELFIRNHMRKQLPKKRASFKRLLRDIGEENIFLFLSLMEADELATNNKPEDKYDRFRETIKSIIEEAAPLSRKGLAIDGRIIMKEFGVSGKLVGEILNHLMEKVLENPKLNTLESLKQHVKVFLEAKDKK